MTRSYSYAKPLTEYERGLRDAYAAAARIVDLDDAAGVEASGIIDNVLAELARLAGVRT